MRAFLAACLVGLILAICGVIALGAVQRPSGVAFATDGARINPHWAWRQTFRRAWRNPPPATGRPQSPEELAAARTQLGPEGCEVANAYQWLFVDFGEANENDACATSQ
jgi:hypothetical protein